MNGFITQTKVGSPPVAKNAETGCLTGMGRMGRKRSGTEILILYILVERYGSILLSILCSLRE
jgi:hypothetical protein